MPSREEKWKSKHDIQHFTMMIRSTKVLHEVELRRDFLDTLAKTENAEQAFGHRGTFPKMMLLE